MTCYGPEAHKNSPMMIRYILGLYRDNGRENGNYCIIIGYTLEDFLKGALQGDPSLGIRRFELNS